MVTSELCAVNRFAQKISWDFIPLLLVLSGMSFNPADKGTKSENTFVNKGLSDFKNKLENLKSDYIQIREESTVLWKRKIHGFMKSLSKQ